MNSLPFLFILILIDQFFSFGGFWQARIFIFHCFVCIASALLSFLAFDCQTLICKALLKDYSCLHAGRFILQLVLIHFFFRLSAGHYDAGTFAVVVSCILCM